MNTELEIMPTSAVEAISRAEVDIQIATAHRFPRQLAKVKSDMLSFATLDEETAQSCFYSLPRGGKNIQGPSIRMAEIAVACYGNLRAGTRIIDTVTKGDSPHVVVQSVCHDLEKNTAITIEKRRRIVGKKSKGGAIDEDDINLAANAGSAIAFRDAVFKVVPGALIRPVYEQAKRVAIGDAKTLSDRRAKAIEAFAKMGVTQGRVLLSLEKASIDEVTIADLETLIGLHTAIKDGHTSIDDAFPTQAKEVAKPTFKPKAEPKTEAKPEQEPESKADTKPETDGFTLEEGKPTSIEILRRNLADSSISEKSFITYVAKAFNSKAKTIGELTEDQADEILGAFAEIAEELSK
jgi:hypothetical protein